MNIPNGSSRTNYVFAHDPTPQQAFYGPNRSATGLMTHKIQQRMETARLQSRDPFQNSNTSVHRFLGSPSKPFQPQYRPQPRMVEVSQGRKYQREQQSDLAFQRKLKVRNAFKPQFRLKSGSSRPDTPEHLRNRLNGFRIETLPSSEFSTEGCSICKTEQVVYDVNEQQQKRNWC